MSRSKEEREDNRARFGFWNSISSDKTRGSACRPPPVAQSARATRPAVLRTAKQRAVVPTENPEGKEYLPNSGDAISKSSASPFPGASAIRTSSMTLGCCIGFLALSFQRKNGRLKTYNTTNKRTIKKQKIRPSKGEGRIFVYRNVCYLQFSTRTKKRRSAPRVHSSNNKRANKNPPLPYVRNSVSSLVSRVPDPSETTLQI